MFSFVIFFYMILVRKIKFNKMKNLFVLIMLLATGIPGYSQSGNGTMIPVTTASTSALSLYKEGKKYEDEVSLVKSVDAYKKALEQDPDFFMVNYHLAFLYLLNQSSDDFEKYSEAAINCKSRLSDAEELLRGAITKLKQGQMNIVDVGDKLVEMYPKDPDSYNNLIYFESLAGDTIRMVETLKKAISIAKNTAPFYNQLGYAYLTLKQADKAKEAFDKYIELEPQNPNVYDSKGDYFMYIKSYDKAYESYMKANSINSDFSREKAAAAKRIYEQETGKPLEIISI
jgi:tetratricopeptide (TPR) repeat protein